MSTHLGGYEAGNSIGEKISMFGVVLVLVALFIAISQPYWRGEEMKTEFVSRCDQLGGTLITQKKMLGTSYECASRLD